MIRRIRNRARLLRRAAVATAVVAATILPAAPAGAEAGDLDIVTVDSSRHPEVQLTVAVPQELAGALLDSGAFALTENGTARPVESRPLGSQSLQVALVIDTSGSMEGTALEAAKAAAAEFALSMPDGTTLSVVGFGSTPSVVSPPSTDHGAAAAAIGGLTATGETALYDGIDLGLRQMTPVVGGRYALVVLSDGGDTVSTIPLETVRSWLAGRTVEFAALELATSETDSTALRSLADAAKGQVVSADAPGQLADVYAAVASDLVNRYQVTYTSATGGATTVRLSLSHGGVDATTERSIRLPAAPAAAPAHVTETLNSQPGWLASRSALLTGFATFAIALLIAGAFVFRPREPRVRTTARAHGSAMERFHVGNLADRATAMADRLLSRHERSPRLNKALERAGIDLRPAEFAVLVSVAAVTASALGWLVGGLWVGLTLPVLAVGAAWFVVHHATARRLAKFGDQLADTLQMLAGSLRAGYSFLQAADAVGRESADPTAEEFRRLLVESRLGRDLSDALGAMHERVGNEDFLWFMQAVAIQREVGGDLAEILDTVAETVRERSRLRRQVSALSAEGRLSAVILFVLPFVVGGFIMLVNPGYLDVLMDSGFGVGLLAFAGGLMAVGGLWLKKLVRITF